MMGIQRYPEVRPAPNSGILEPYDVAAWSLPLMMGVKAERVSITPDVQNSSRILETVTWPTGGLAKRLGKYFSIAASPEQHLRSRQRHASRWRPGLPLQSKSQAKLPNLFSPRTRSSPPTPKNSICSSFRARIFPRAPRSSNNRSRRSLQALHPLTRRRLDALPPRAIRLQAKKHRKQGSAEQAISTIPTT